MVDQGNYILTRMENEGIAFDAVLKDAQRLGFAEAARMHCLSAGLTLKQTLYVKARGKTGVVIHQMVGLLYSDKISHCT